MEAKYNKENKKVEKYRKIIWSLSDVFLSSSHEKSTLSYSRVSHKKSALLLLKKLLGLFPWYHSIYSSKDSKFFSASMIYITNKKVDKSSRLSMTNKSLNIIKIALFQSIVLSRQDVIIHRIDSIHKMTSVYLHLTPHLVHKHLQQSFLRFYLLPYNHSYACIDL